jgi:hypothetical protein
MAPGSSSRLRRVRRARPPTGSAMVRAAAVAICSSAISLRPCPSMTSLRWNIPSSRCPRGPTGGCWTTNTAAPRVSITPSVKGRATIFDADILIFCISQLMAAINAGRPTSRVLTLTAHDLLLATGRETSGDAYRRLRDAFERLAGTRITTNITTGPKDDPREITTGFGLIESLGDRAPHPRGPYGVGHRDAERMALQRGPGEIGPDAEPGVFRAAQTAGAAALRAGAQTLRIATRLAHLGASSVEEIRLYIAGSGLSRDAAREHPRRQPARLRLHRRARRHPLCHAPCGGDRTGRGADAVRPIRWRPRAALRPGEDVYALEARWRGVWAATGRPRLRAPDKVFLGWLKIGVVSGLDARRQFSREKTRDASVFSRPDATAAARRATRRPTEAHDIDLNRPISRSCVDKSWALPFFWVSEPSVGLC